MPLTYSIIVTNTGPISVASAPVTDTFPSELTSVTWTCSASSGSSCGSASGSGNLNTTANLLAGGTVTYTVNATVAASASGSITNTAFVAAPGGVTETNLGNNSAQDVDTLNPTVDLGITKTDDQTTAVPGQSLTYTIVATNAGPSNVTGATITDTFPSELTGVTWTLYARVRFVVRCASGSGNLNTTANLLVGGTVTYTVNATVSCFGEWFDHEHGVRCGAGWCDGNESGKQLGARCGYAEPDGGSWRSPRRIIKRRQCLDKRWCIRSWRRTRVRVT